jgi:hypothetical protein
MTPKSIAAGLYARIVHKKIARDAERALECQDKIMHMLLSAGRTTAYGNDQHLHQVSEYSEWKHALPVVEYERLIPYIDRAKAGERNVLWPGKPKYFCKTSGTTSGTKYIPLTADSLPNHIGTARNALLSYIAETGQSSFTSGKMIFLQGSPKMDVLPSGIPYGRLSGIVANHVPAYLQKNRMPSYKTNCIEDWEEKVNRIAEETLRERMTLISGIPNWVQMYFEVLLKKSGKQSIREVFPDFDLFVYGGVNFEPYRARFEQLIGKRIPIIELYPASEGFLAFQDSQEADGLLLNVNSGIFFEFIPADEYFQATPTRLSLRDVKVGVNYALVLSNNAGLWSYSIGDTVKFTSLQPPRIKVTGRIKHFTSAFGEHVIAEEVEGAMTEVCNVLGIRVNEFHVAPMVAPVNGLPYHEWFIETDSEVPVYLQKRMAEMLDASMQQRNIYYRDLIQGGVLRPAFLTFVSKGSFNEYMRSVGKLGGQNKVPRLANDRVIAEALGLFNG